MGDRFYRQQLEATGDCPGNRNPNKRKKRMAWTDEKKAAVIEAYENAEPTPENSMEIVKEIAEEFEESPNGVRMVLTKAGVYVKKAAASGGSSTSSKASTGGSRVSKAAAVEALTAAIQDAGQEADEEILSKLTGKAAQYFTTVINAINN
jgi:transposase-like protein